MQRLVIAVGELPQGGVAGLYVGQDADAALAAIEKAGQEGEITCGFFIRNPSVSRRISFVRTSAEVEAGKTTVALRAEQAAVTAQAKVLGAKAAGEAMAVIKGVIASAAAAPADAAELPAALPTEEPDEQSEGNHFGTSHKPRRR